MFPLHQDRAKGGRAGRTSDSSARRVPIIGPPVAPAAPGRRRLRSLSLLFLSLCFCTSAWPQQRPARQDVFTRDDTLRGMLTPFRSCYDVRFYHLDVRIDPSNRTVRGSTTVAFTADSAFRVMQLDLFKNMDVDSIILDDVRPLKFSREGNAIFVMTGELLRKGTSHRVKVYYGGTPVVARRPPWEGGFTWTTDSSGNPWVVVTCQGTGASLWWPNKDHQSDKPDSMMISITVPPGLTDISNGRLRDSVLLPDGWTRFDWFVSYPINNYNATVNIGRFSHFSDVYMGIDTVTLDYYVLPQNIDKARAQFVQVKAMLAAYERFFGPYPFRRDGYKLIESPHTGMEHQSAVAYGNLYLNGYRGRTSSPVGLTFDFIIIHESAHEWWGNSVTANDIADMWIHESFAAYAEALYVEYVSGRDASRAYINGKKQNVRNTAPILGVFNVQHEGSGDMYDKGQLVLNTLRSVINNDSLWFTILRTVQAAYRYRSVNGEDIIRIVDSLTRDDYGSFFDQYLKYPSIPVLEVVVISKGDEETARYRWKADVPGFHMPVKVTEGRGAYMRIIPTPEWQTMKLDDLPPPQFKIADDDFYAGLKLSWVYLDPRLPSSPRRAE